MSAVALTDTGNLHGAVEFVLAAKQAGIKPILGVEINLERKPLLLYVESASGYRNLNRLLSRHAELAATDGDEASVANQQRGSYNRQGIARLTEGLIAVSEDLRLAELFPGRFYSLASPGKKSATRSSVACPAIRYATAADRQKFDIVQSIRTLTLLRQEHPKNDAAGGFIFAHPRRNGGRCQEHPGMAATHAEIAERCNFELPFGKPQFPAFIPPDGSPPARISAPAGAGRFAASVTARAPANSAAGDGGTWASSTRSVTRNIFSSPGIFSRNAGRRGIEWITRGSAADSLVCYCLGHQRRLPDPLRSLFPPLSQQGPHGAEQTARH
jgi:DNA polymerase III alpha subunit